MSLLISLSDDTVEGLMLWKMNSELLDLNDDKIMQDICKKYEKNQINLLIPMKLLL